MTEKTTGIITYTASGVAMLGGVTLTDWAALVGALVAVLSFLYSIWHKTQLRKIARERVVIDDIEEVDA